MMYRFVNPAEMFLLCSYSNSRAGCVEPKLGKYFPELMFSFFSFGEYIVHLSVHVYIFM